MKRRKIDEIAEKLTDFEQKQRRREWNAEKIDEIAEKLTEFEQKQRRREWNAEKIDEIAEKLTEFEQKQRRREWNAEIWRTMAWVEAKFKRIEWFQSCHILD